MKQKKAKPAADTSTASPITSDKPTPLCAANLPILLFVLRGVGFLLLGLIGIAWWRPDLRLWGLHHLAFLPLPLSIALIGLSAVCWLPLGERCVAWIGEKVQVLANRSAWLWGLAMVAVFFGLRVAVPLLGDGSLWIKELAWIGEYQARGTELPMERWKARKEPLEIAIHEMVFRTACHFRPVDYPGTNQAEAELALRKRGKWLSDAANRTYTWLSILAGAVACLALLRFARRRILPTSRRMFLLLFFSCSGLLLFFGYVEHYSLVSAAVICFLLSGLDESFPPRRFPWKTVSTFLVAVACHLAAIYLTPALLFFLYSFYVRREEESGQAIAYKRVFVVLSLFAALGLVGYVYVRGWNGWLSVSPLLPQLSRDGYALLSWIHGADLLNLLALIALPSLLILIVLRVSGQQDYWTQTRFGFLATAAISGLCFVFSFDPNLGMARDWDLLMVALWPLVIFAAWKLSQVDYQAAGDSITAALIGYALLTAVPFILVQSYSTTSITRMETVLNLDQSRSAYGWENLATYYETIGDMDGRVRAWSAASNVSNNPRYKVNVSVALRQAGRLEEAEPYAIQAAKQDRKYAYQLNYIAVIYANRRLFDKARDLLSLSHSIEPSDTSTTRLLDQVNRDLAGPGLSAQTGRVALQQSN